MSDERTRDEESMRPEHQEVEPPKNPPVQGVTGGASIPASREEEPPPPPPGVAGSGGTGTADLQESRETEGPKNPPVEGAAGFGGDMASMQPEGVVYDHPPPPPRAG
jgi:hypothetical protein